MYVHKIYNKWCLYQTETELSVKLIASFTSDVFKISVLIIS